MLNSDLGRGIEQIYNTFVDFEFRGEVDVLLQGHNIEFILLAFLILGIFLLKDVSQEMTLPRYFKRPTLFSWEPSTV